MGTFRLDVEKLCTDTGVRLLFRNVSTALSLSQVDLLAQSPARSHLSLAVQSPVAASPPPKQEGSVTEGTCVGVKKIKVNDSEVVFLFLLL